MSTSTPASTPRGKYGIDKPALVLAILAILCAVARLLFPSGTERIDDTTLKYLAAAGVLLLLGKVRSLSFGDWKAEFEEAKREAQEALEEAKTAASMVRLTSEESRDDFRSPGEPAGHRTLSRSRAGDEGKRRSWTMKPGAVDDDPWKGVFGGKPENNHRRLTATVSPSRGDPEWFRVQLMVESTDPKTHPLVGRVRFFLHDTFSNDKPFVRVTDGIAELRLGSYGAFTVGVLADDGQTRLELDLAEDESFPRGFREN